MGFHSPRPLRVPEIHEDLNEVKSLGRMLAAQTLGEACRGEEEGSLAMASLGGSLQRIGNVRALIGLNSTVLEGISSAGTVQAEGKCELSGSFTTSLGVLRVSRPFSCSGRQPRPSCIGSTRDQRALGYVQEASIVARHVTCYLPVVMAFDPNSVGQHEMFVHGARQPVAVRLGTTVSGRCRR